MTSGGERADSDLVLIAAGTGPEVTGWLFGIERPTPGAVVEEIDRLNTSGVIAVKERLYRILSSASEPNASADLMVYDSTGVVAYHRMDGLADPHGLIWDGTHLIVPCSFSNEIVWLTPDGQRSRVWRAPGEGDAWHINGVHLRDGTLYASAFGVFETHRGWAKAMSAPTGLIFEVETQNPIVTGFTCPHDPMFVDGGWLVCDSYRSRILFVDKTDRTTWRELDLGGWTRGVAVTNDRIFVGVSAARHGAGNKERARIVVLDRVDWRIVGKIDLPCEEISALALVPREFMPGLRRGFRTNNLRTGVQDRRDLFELAGPRASALKTTPMEAIIEPRNFRVRINVKAPREVQGGAMFDAQLVIKNRGRRTIFSAPPFPVNVAAIFEEVGTKPQAAEVRRDALPEPIAPGATRRFRLSIQSPLKPGSYRVRFTLVQEWIRWFDNDNRWLARLLSSNRRNIRMKIVGRQPESPQAQQHTLPIEQHSPLCGNEPPNPQPAIELEAPDSAHR